MGSTAATTTPIRVGMGTWLEARGVMEQKDRVMGQNVRETVMGWGRKKEKAWRREQVREGVAEEIKSVREMGGMG